MDNVNNARLKADILRVFKPIIASWTEPDIYAISFWVNNYCDNPCEPTVTLGYNTERQYVKEISNVSDKAEARWNFAFWLQNTEFVYGEGETKDNVANWIMSSGMPYYPCIDYDWDIPDDIDDKLLYKITMEFVGILVNTVKELHITSFIQEKFGKPTPILVHELEYYHQIADQNIAANSLPIVRDFVEWIRSMYLI